MPDDPQTPALAGRWIEVREQGDAERVVLMAADSDVPPGRGRRGLRLEADGAAEAQGPGADDRTVGREGRWSSAGDRLTIEAGAWSGEYRIEETGPKKLVLRRK